MKWSSQRSDNKYTMNIFLSGVRNKLVHDCFLLDEAFSMHAKLKEKKTRRASSKLLLATTTSKFEHLSECAKARNPSHSASFLLTRSPGPIWATKSPKARRKKRSRIRSLRQSFAPCVVVNRISQSHSPLAALLVCSLTKSTVPPGSSAHPPSLLQGTCHVLIDDLGGRPRVICCARGWNQWALSSCFPRACCRRVMALEPSAAAGPSSSPRTPTCGRRRRPWRQWSRGWRSGRGRRWWATRPARRPPASLHGPYYLRGWWLWTCQWRPHTARQHQCRRRRRSPWRLASRGWSSSGRAEGRE